MKQRKAYELKWPLFMWNSLLALFSLVMLIRTSHDILYLITNFGVGISVCKTFAHPGRGFWSFLFIISKFIEFGDTVFLIARKREIIFLHWYHHVTVLLVTWMAGTDSSSIGRYFIAMNCLVHSFMYTYYALESVSIRPPKWVSVSITVLQILQMAGGLWVVMHAHSTLAAGNQCEVSPYVIKFFLLVYASYFVLFVNFFVQRYLWSAKSAGKKSS